MILESRPLLRSTWFAAHKPWKKRMAGDFSPAIHPLNRPLCFRIGTAGFEPATP